MNLRALIATLLIPSLALAEEPLPVPAIVTFPAGEDNIVAVKKGESAPYAGQLFDENTSLRWAMWLQQYKLRYGTDLKAAKDACAVNIQREKEYRSIEEDRNKKSEEDLRQRLLQAEKARLEAEEKLRNPPLWKEPNLWYAIGIVTTAVLVVLVQEQK
jgi:hypothetical protein